MLQRVKRLAIALLVLAACSRSSRRGGEAPLLLPESRRVMSEAQQKAAAPAVAALQAGRFADAERAAGEVLAGDAHNPQARLVRALGRYQRAITLLMHDAAQVSDQADTLHTFDHPRMRARYLTTDDELAAVNEDLDRGVGVFQRQPRAVSGVLERGLEPRWQGQRARPPPHGNRKRR